MGRLNGNVEESQITKDGFDTLEKALTDDSDRCQDSCKDLELFADLEKATVHGFEAQIKEFRELPSICPRHSQKIIEELKAREFNEKISEQFMTTYS